jgi:hypothetical protein
MFEAEGTADIGVLAYDQYLVPNRKCSSLSLQMAGVPG